MGPWSATETDTLIRMWPTASAAQIASHLHRSRAVGLPKGAVAAPDGLLPPDVEKHFEVDPWRPGGARPEFGTVPQIIPCRVWRPCPKPGAPDLEALRMRPCALAELDDSRCHWPLGLLHEVATLFCGGGHGGGSALLRAPSATGHGSLKSAGTGRKLIADTV